MTTLPELCQACRFAPVEVLVEEHDAIKPYRVCSACARRLDSLSLRPLEWFNLAALYGPNRVLLEEDYYSDHGIAEQPQEEVEEPERYPAPTLEEVKHDRERLLDYAMTLYSVDEPTRAALERQDKEALLASLQWRVTVSCSPSIESSAYDICADVIGPVAATWIRERWDAWSPDTFDALVRASAKCLSLEETFTRVVQILDDESARSRLEQPGHYWSGEHSTLARFHLPRTLDWMEAHPSATRHQTWGEVAAQSHFSWPRAVDWLGRGRPLSRIALYALRACFYHDSASELEYQPTLEEPAPVETMLQRLQEYQEADAAPHVRDLIREIREKMLPDKV